MRKTFVSNEYLSSALRASKYFDNFLFALMSVEEIVRNKSITQ